MRSQVLPYLREMSDEYTFDLMTYEQGESPTPPSSELGAVRLHRLRYHKRPWPLAKSLDLVAGVITALWLALRRDVVLLHARSHVAATVTLTVAAMTRRPFIFDMRGFLADEFVEAGAWRRGGLRHRVVLWIERLLLRTSTAVVVLTERARELLLTEPQSASLVRGKEIVVVPCCVELSRFVPRSGGHSDDLAYVGSVGTWYLLDEMLRFFASYAALKPGARFAIANSGQHDLLRARLAASKLAERITVEAVPYDGIPNFLAGRAAGIVLLREGRSKLASSPIKIAEYLAAGLAVVINEVVGDVPRLAREHQVGVVVRGLDDAALADGARALAELLADGGRVRERARKLAEEHYDVRKGARTYADLYGRIRASARTK